MTIAREGWVFVGTLLGIGLLLALFRLPWFAGVVLALGLFTAFFFRDPERAVPSDPRLVLSPADGKVILVVPAPGDHPFGPGTMQVSIFLSVFDVHINRSPIAGTVDPREVPPGQVPAGLGRQGVAAERAERRHRRERCRPGRVQADRGPHRAPHRLQEARRRRGRARASGSA